MMIFLFIISLTISNVYLQDCPPADTLTINTNQNNWDIPYINNWNELEIITWNIKTFPLSNNTIEDVAEILSDLMPDVINFQEINSNSGFDQLMNLLPIYDFVYSNDEYYGLAIAYRKDCLELLNTSILFEDFPWEFTYRYPLSAEFVWRCGESYMLFEMINVHLKCCGDGKLDENNTSDEETRRLWSNYY